jgi:type I restriction enzyme S subunit
MKSRSKRPPHASRTGGREATHGVIPGRYALSVGLPDLPCPKGWRWVALSEVAQLESGHTPSRRHPEYWGGDVPWIGIRDAVDNHGRTITDTVQHVSKLGLANSSSRLLPRGTVCLSRTASVGYVVVMGRPMATSQDFVNWVCTESLEPDFLKYILLAERDSLMRFASGTTHQTIYYPEAKAFHVLLPPMHEQRGILSVLKTIDEKIELNRKMSGTLEAIARALFKSWFVDFDPVRAKAEGRDPCLAAEIAPLFPDSFKDSQLGEIPNGWCVERFDSILARRTERREPSSETAKSPYVPIDCISSRSFLLEMTKPGTEARSSLTAFYKRDILFGAMRPYFHKVCIAPFDGTTRTTVFVLSPRREGDWSFAALLAHRDETIDYATAHSTGSTIPYAVWDRSLDGMPVVTPPAALRDCFNDVVSPMLDRIRCVHFENATLAALRDVLLPKLISGELRVEEAERIAERTADVGLP